MRLHVYWLNEIQSDMRLLNLICVSSSSPIIRNVLGLTGANSEEFSQTASPAAVVFMPEINPEVMGGTMRLGQRATHISLKVKGKPSLASHLYHHNEGK